jgi:peptidyl-prolyl cis-trans isomerase C
MRISRSWTGLELTLNKLRFLAPLVLMMVLLQAQAQAQVLPKGVFATVNGEPLSENLLEVNLQANIARGVTNSPQLRASLKNELIGQEVLAQEARKLKLEEAPQAKAMWQQMQLNYLAALLLSNHAQTNPVSESQVKLEYEKFTKEMMGAKEYRISIITVPTQARANALITQLNQSQDKGLFAKLANVESTDASKGQGGQLDWLLPQQMLPAIANVVANLSKGRLSAVPIQTPSGWNVTRLDDVRNYTPPEMTDIEAQLRQAAAREALSNYVKGLRDKAKIVQ